MKIFVAGVLVGIRVGSADGRMLAVVIGVRFPHPAGRSHGTTSTGPSRMLFSPLSLGIVLWYTFNITHFYVIGVFLGPFCASVTYQFWNCYEDFRILLPFFVRGGRGELLLSTEEHGGARRTPCLSHGGRGELSFLVHGGTRRGTESFLFEPRRARSTDLLSGAGRGECQRGDELWKSWGGGGVCGRRCGRG